MSISKPILLVIIIVGTSAGWFASQFASQEGQVSTARTNSVGAVIASEETSSVQELKNNEYGDGQSDAALSGKKVAVESTVEAELKALIYENTENHELTAKRILEYLDLLWGDRAEGLSAAKDVRNLIRSVPEINLLLLDKLMSIENENVRFKLEMVFMINNSSQRPFLEPAVMEKVKLNENRSEWLKIIGDWGLQAKSNIAYLVNEMPYFENPGDVGSSIRAIANSSWAWNSALSPNEHKKVSEIIQAYHASEHAEIRAASIAALGSFPQSDFQQRIIAGLKDPSQIVRNEAAMLYSNNPFQSAEVEELLAEQEER